MDWTVNGIEFLSTEVVGVGKHVLVNRSDERERSVEYQSCFSGTVDILIGIADSNGTNGCRCSSSHTTYCDGNIETETDEVDSII